MSAAAEFPPKPIAIGDVAADLQRVYDKLQELSRAAYYCRLTGCSESDQRMLAGCLESSAATVGKTKNWAEVYADEKKPAPAEVAK